MRYIPTTSNRDDWPRLVAQAVNYLIRNFEVTFSPLNHALTVIKEEYGITAAYRPKILIKSGRSGLVGTSYSTVQEHGGTETLLTTNLIDTVVSSAVGDTQSVTIEGHTIDGSGDLTFVTQNATLNGTANVTLATPLARADKITNNGATVFAGTVKVFDATFPAVTYVQAGGTYNQSEKAAVSVSQSEYWVITGVMGAVLEKTASSADFSLQVRSTSGVFREVYAWSGGSASASTFQNLTVPIIVPANSDVRIQALASGVDTECIAQAEGYIARDTSA